MELNEVMHTLEVGVLTAGFLLMAAAALSVLVFGRFFCSWGVPTSWPWRDLSAWLLARARIRPRPVRSRVLALVAPGAALYMFVWPQLSRVLRGEPRPEIEVLTDSEGWASFVTTDLWRNLPGAVDFDPDVRRLRLRHRLLPRHSRLLYVRLSLRDGIQADGPVRSRPHSGGRRLYPVWDLHRGLPVPCAGSPRDRGLRPDPRSGLPQRPSTASAPAPTMCCPTGLGRPVSAADVPSHPDRGAALRLHAARGCG